MKRMKKTVLLVTNSVLTREVLVGPLGEHGYAVVVKDGIREATGVCGGKRPDLLLVDLDWPHDAGWMGWGLIRGAFKAVPPLPVVIITGRADVAEAAGGDGVRGLAEKPLDVGSLLALVEKLLKGAADSGGGLDGRRVGCFDRVPASEKALEETMVGHLQRSFLPDRVSRHCNQNE